MPAKWIAAIAVSIGAPSLQACAGAPEPGIQLQRVEHIVIYYEPGRFGGWPANHGIWSWDNEILVGFGRGYYKDLGPARHHIDRERPEEHWLARSRDAGRTWTLEHPAENGQLIPRGDALHGIEDPDRPIPPLRDCPGGIDFTHPDFAMTLRMSSIHDGESRFEYSNDRGRNWEGPFRLPGFDAPGTAARTAYLVDGPGELTAFITAAKADGREGRAICIRTSDGGATWRKIGGIGPEPSGFSIMPSAVRLDDGALVAAVRRREPLRRWIGLWRSQDNGATWEQLPDPAPNLGEGNPPSLIRLDDGRLCLTYAVRAEPFRVCARISGDGGETWSPEYILRGDGVDRDIGYVQSVQTPGGHVVSVYYITNPRTAPERSIEATRWDPAEIE